MSNVQGQSKIMSVKNQVAKKHYENNVAYSNLEFVNKDIVDEIDNKSIRRDEASLSVDTALFNSILPSSFIGEDTSEVNVIYGIKKPNEIAYSVSTVSHNQLANNSVHSFGNALYGRIPGLYVAQTRGEPGNDNPILRIRGNHSFTGDNAPLVLVDGFERDYSTLSIEEVESVSVLKDASSAVLYGMDGANGIILITTKRGISSKPKVGFKVERGYQQPIKIPTFYGSYDYANFYNMAQRNDGKTNLLYSEEQLDGYKNNEDEMLYPNVDWLSETINKYSTTQKYVLDFRGGNEKTQYYVNANYQNIEGIYKNSNHGSYSTNNNLSRLNFRSNINLFLLNYLTIKLDLAGRLEDINSPTASSTSIFNNLYTFHPNVSPVFVTTGIYGGTNTYRNNPVAFINEQGYKKTHRRYFQSNISFDYDLSRYIKGLSIGVRTAFDDYYTVQDGQSKTYGVSSVIGKNSEDPSKYLISELYGINSNLSLLGPSAEAEYRRNNIELYGKYTNVFGKHTFNSLIFYHQREFVNGPNFPDRRMGLSAEISYDYLHKYYVNVAANYGGSENFIKSKRFGFFPAVSAAWIVSSEDFMKNQSLVSFLKLRASTGLVGSQNIGGVRFGYRTIYSSSGVEQALGNPNLTWEKSFKTDFGFDMTILKSINVMFTYFKENRYDILNSGNALYPAFLGNTFNYTNYGQVKSMGFEVSINYEKTLDKLSYFIGANFTSTKNTITRMREIYQTETYLYRQGNPINQRFGLVALGFFQSQEEIDNSPVQTFGNVIPGSLKYKDINRDNIIDSKDLTPIGKNSTVPNVDIGINTGFEIFVFYLQANIQTVFGRDVDLRHPENGAQYSVTPLYGDKNISTFVKKPWTKDDPYNADYPSLSIENAANNFQTSTFWLRNGNFLRLRAMEIGYNFPQKWVDKFKIDGITIYLRGMNLVTLDHIRYFDPEVMEGYPLMKSYNLGIKINL